MNTFITIILLLLVAFLPTVCDAYGWPSGRRKSDFHGNDWSPAPQRYRAEGWDDEQRGRWNGRRRGGWDDDEYGWRGYDRAWSQPSYRWGTSGWRGGLASLFFGK
uniref:Uncharacterized protein n=1 Tax=Plectus sambesii TaxID=2011161 RepID=A0A914X9G2_9BILA